MRMQFPVPGNWIRGTGLVIAGVLVLAACLSGVMAAPASAQVPLPRIDGLLPDNGPVGTTVAIVGENFGGRALLSRVTFNGVEAIPLTWSDALITARVPRGATTGPVVVTVLGVLPSNAVEFTVTDPPEPSNRWYLAEGCTDHGFETFITMQNSGALDATAGMVLNTARFGRIPVPARFNLPAGSRTTVRLNDFLPGADVSTIVESTQPIVCERTTYWNNRLEGHESVGVPETSRTWYLAEGSTAHGFETWIAIQNPAASPATVNITYLTSSGKVERAPLVIGAGSRATVAAALDVGACDVSAVVESDIPVVCERSMYWDSRRGGHSSIGAVGGSRSWFLAEGSTAHGFETWVVLQNPGWEIADVQVTYMTGEGPMPEPVFSMGPYSRHAILVNDRLPGRDVSIRVESDVEIIAERAMYWNNGTGRAGHGTIASPHTSGEIHFAEGSTAWGFETFVCVQNPTEQQASASVIFLTGEGPVPGPVLVLEPGSRATLDLNQYIPDRDVAVVLKSGVPLMAERSMYWHARGGGHVSIGFME